MSPHDEIPIPLKPRANPGQVLTINNVDDRTEIVRLLKHLTPDMRVKYLEWCCSQTYIPGSWIRPKVASDTYKLLEQARSSDEANERLMVDIILSLTMMWCNFSLDAKRCLDHLVLMARRKA